MNTIDDLDIASFLNILRTQRRASERTLTSYQRDFALLLQLKQAKHWHEITTQDVRLWISLLHTRKLSPRSIARTLSAWRSFWRWMLHDQRISSDLSPFHSVKAPKARKKLPQALSVDEAIGLFSQHDQHHTAAPLQTRDLAMLELFYSSGLRLAELAALNLPHIDGRLDLTVRMLMVAGKGDKHRLVPIGKPACLAIQQWLAIRPTLDPQQQEPALFISQQGTRLSHRSIQKRIEKLGHTAQQSLHPHRLRHAFASHFLQSSGDLRATQALLGHANISSTQIYTHLDFQTLSTTYDQTHPRARKKNTN